MKQLAIALGLVASSLAACVGSDSYYVYPSDYSNELEYVCLHVMQRGTRRFMVNDQHAVIPLRLQEVESCRKSKQIWHLEDISVEPLMIGKSLARKEKRVT